MSYTHAMSRMSGLGDEYADQKSCLDRANASPQVAGIDGIISNLAKTWNPTGFYRPGDIQTLLDMFATEAEKAGAALASAPNSTGDAAQVKAQAFDDMLRKYKDRSQAYVAAIADARARGATAISAPALKSWVIAAMQSISDAYVTATVLQCRQTWAEKWLDRGYQAMVAIGAVTARILGVVVKVGESVVAAVDTAGDIVAFVVRYSPYIGGALGAYLLYHWMKKRSS